ncbi:hypothetical protein DFR86_07615 [Acidianus sulfidivorans JP7]|uniref:5,10-methenyltetrahydrofolate synthetase n=1 Tax=Acidianus sulfidivorans JP7 TaxID=619593 RepID=A0A2U9IMZ1_9CREN|nr:hypothetical protein [Acidianus sulfidivorans]AWR97429.1 hypothetical protein DFR86_07615 [Acidianus sulfidivorans JP7]
MQLLVELHPKSKIEKIKKEIDDLSHFDGYDIPDLPLGIPSVIPVSIASIIRDKFDDKRIIVNQRLLDVNELYVHGLAITAKAFNLQIAFTKGDKPKIGKEVGYLSSEDAIRIAKQYNIISGMMLSLRKPKFEVQSRLEFNDADFFLGLHFYNTEILKSLINIEKIIPYIIIRTEKNKDILSTISQPSVSIEKVKYVIDELESLGVKSVLLSSPKDLDALNKIS